MLGPPAQAPAVGGRGSPLLKEEAIERERPPRPPALRDISERNSSYKLDFGMNPCDVQFDLTGADSHSLGDEAEAESRWETRVSEPLDSDI